MNTQVLSYNPTTYATSPQKFHASPMGQHHQIYMPANPTPSIASDPTRQTPPRQMNQQDPESTMPHPVNTDKSTSRTPCS
mmetsp:Transcript_23504/g.42086  ORF Transcript_23504/g.42086 Transcript_23504/m.42086 type:complete len:80 (+) Transcript_23504:11-250(+)